MRELMVKLSKGNPGALQVLIQLHQAGADDCLTLCEKQGLAGSNLWVLFKDVHKFDIEAVIASIRGNRAINEVVASERRE